MKIKQERMDKFVKQLYVIAGFYVVGNVLFMVGLFGFIILS